MAKKEDFPNIVILRNKFGTAIGVEIDGKRLPFVNKVAIVYDVKGLPTVKLDVFSQNISFKDIDTPLSAVDVEVKHG